MKRASISVMILSGFLIATGARADDKPAAAAPTAAPAAKSSHKDKKAAKGQKNAKATAAVKGPEGGAAPIVEVKTSLGTFKLQLDEKAAPETVKNFLGYVNDKFYDGTIFHRVIKDFMIQGGGFTQDGEKLTEKTTKSPVKNEGKNGLKNDRGTIAMARTGDPDSATAQFFINHGNNESLNYPKPDGFGYAVFGKVIDGMDVVDKIASAKTGVKAGMQDVPVDEVKIIAVTVAKPAG